MDITKADFLTIGLLRADGTEPDDWDYKRVPIRLRWDPSNFDEVYTNGEEVRFQHAVNGWGRIERAALFAGAARVTCFALTGPMGVYPSTEAFFAPRSISIPRAALLDRYTDDQATFSSLEKVRVVRDYHTLSAMECVVKYELEWPRRYPNGRPQLEQPLGAAGYSNKWFDGDLRVELEKKQRDLERKFGNPDAIRGLAAARAIREQEALYAKAHEGALLQAELDLRMRGVGGPLGTSSATREAWKTGPLIEGGQLTPQKIMEMARALADRTVFSVEKYPNGPIEPTRPAHPKVDKLSGRALGKPPEERKIVVPVPRFWGQLDQALNAHKKPPPPKDMPTVEATPAGAEELIDWARSHEDKAAWAEKLSIPRVCRMLKEMTSYGKTWAESDLCALAGS